MVEIETILKEVRKIVPLRITAYGTYVVSPSFIKKLKTMSSKELSKLLDEIGKLQDKIFELKNKAYAELEEYEKTSEVKWAKKVNPLELSEEQLKKRRKILEKLGDLLEKYYTLSDLSASLASVIIGIVDELERKGE